MKRCYINAASSIHSEGMVSDSGILKAVVPDYTSIINSNARRRMGHLVKMGVACALDCIEQGGNKPMNAIITATGLGCLADTEKFLKALISDHEEAPPTPFIQSSFNTMGAQIALLTGNHGYNNTYVHRGLSFESALTDAGMRIREGDSRVLTGAADEVTETSRILMERLGLSEGTILGEGAGFFILSSEKNNLTLAELLGVCTFTGLLPDEILHEKMNNFLKGNKIEFEEIGYFMTGRNGNPNHDACYEKAEQLFPRAHLFTFKDQCGEYPTASAFGLWKSLKILKEVRSNNGYLLLYNQYNRVNHSLILLKK